ncbi:MAG: hypothetical protein IPH88_04235 [Bacteroidales bacterium]|nr:hypothetical protein [Bacteroidales bacterium]
MKTLSRFLFFLLIFAGATAVVRAQRPLQKLNVIPYGVDQGLNQSMVRQICQDSRGLIWMVTGDGLQCFDGESFKAFRYAGEANGSVSENIMREIVEHRPGEFTISSTSSVLQFSSANGKFSLVERQIAQYPRIFNLLLNNQAFGWFPNKIFCVNDNQKTVKLDFRYPKGIKPPANFYPSRAVRSRFGTILIQGQNGILTIDETHPIGKYTFNAFWFPTESECMGITADINGDILVLAGKQILKYSSDNVFTSWMELEFTGDCLFADSKNQLWISDWQNGHLYRIENGKTSEIVFVSREGKQTVEHKPAVINIFEDHQNNLWFGTDGDGVYLYTPARMQFLNAAIGFTRCLLEVDGDIWAGTYKEGLWRLSNDLSRSDRIHLPFNDSEFYYVDMTIDKWQHIWLATTKGVWVIDKKGKLLFSKSYDCNAPIFIESSDDTVRLSLNNFLYVFSGSESPRFSYSQAYCPVRVVRDYKGKRWIGSPFGLYFGESRELISKDLQFDNARRLSVQSVFDILPLKSGVWVATERGIDRYSPEGKRLKVPEAISELKDEVIYSLIPDSQNRIWFSSNSGIGCISGDYKTIIRFGTLNNLQSLEFNSNAALKASKGYIYFGGIKGLNGFSPEAFIPQNKGPDTHLYSLFLSDSAYSNGIPAEDIKVELNRKAAHLEGKVFSPDYMSSGKKLFSFMLAGYQDSWSKPAASPSFVYRNLPPGEYQLWAKCIDASNNTGKAIRLISVVIRPPFWKTTAFILIFISILIFATILIVRKIQGNRYRNKLRELEHANAIDKERLRISKDMHDEVGASLTRISILSELAKQRSGDREKSMEIIQQINEISGNVVDEMSEIIWTINPQNDNLVNFSSYFRQYASSYLETANIDSILRFPDEIKPLHMAAELRRNVFLTAKEALHNLVKHAPGCKATVSLQVHGNVLHMIIEDNGPGFTSGEGNAFGNGLINMKRRMEECGGKFSLVSEPGKGSKVEFSVPVG